MAGRVAANLSLDGGPRMEPPGEFPGPPGGTPGGSLPWGKLGDTKEPTAG